MKRVFCIFTLLCVVLAAGTLYAGPTLDAITKRGELIVGTSGDYPPLTAKTKDGKPIGLDADLARLIGEAMGVKTKIVFVPFVELLAHLQAGKIDMIISNMTMTPKRNLQVVFVGPYFLSGQAVLMTKTSSAGIRDLESLNKAGFIIAVPQGTTSEIVAKEKLAKASLTMVKSMDEAVSLLLAGKAKAVFSDAVTCALATARYSDKDLTSSDPLTFEPIGIAIPANDPHLVNWLDNFLMLLRGSGGLSEMTEKWITDPSWVKQLP